jgi:hypothetical protein
MSKAAELAALIGGTSGSSLSNRNMIINGAMNVAQRGDQTGVTDGFACDRFNIVDGNTTAVVDASQSSTSPDGFANSLKVDVTTAQSSLSSNSVDYIRYKFEGQNLQQLQYGTSSAKKVTVSFYVRSSTTGTYVFNMYSNDSNRTSRQTYTIDSADTWERKTLTFNGDTSNGFDDDNNASLSLHWVLAAGSDYTGGSLAENTWGTYASNLFAEGQTVNLLSSTSNDFHITGVQLEIGEQATPFEHRSFGDELAACQRYYQKTFAYATVPAQNLDTYSGSIMGVARSVTSTSAWEPCGTWDLAVSMRATPSIVSFNPYVANAEWGNSSAVSSSNFRVLASTADRISCDNTGNTVNFGNNNPAIQLTAEAEL